MKTLALMAMTFTLMHSGATAAPLYTFTTPDAPLQTVPGDGLNAKIWSDAAIAPVDTLADARTYITSTDPDADATFISTEVDYPNGLGDTTGSATTLISAALGVDAASLTDGDKTAATVGGTHVLNSIIQFSGFLSVSAPGSLDLAVASDDGSEAYRWEDGVVERLGDLPGDHFSSFAKGVSADGSVVVGQGDSAFGSEAFRWEEGVMAGLRSRLRKMRLPGMRSTAPPEGCGSRAKAAQAP